MKKENLSVADVVCAKEYISGYNSSGHPMVDKGMRKFFPGFAIVLDPVDEEVSDPTCSIMLPDGVIIRVKEERLIPVIKNDSN